MPGGVEGAAAAPLLGWMMPESKQPTVIKDAVARRRVPARDGAGDRKQEDSAPLLGWMMPENHSSIKLKDARPKAPGGGDGGMRRVATLAERIERVPAAFFARLEVVFGKVQDLKPIPGAHVLFDPPYLGAPRYAEVLPREEVLDVARAWSKVAARIVVCEGEPLPLDGWATWRLAAKEWVTVWGVPHLPAEQLSLVPTVYRSDRKR